MSRLNVAPGEEVVVEHAPNTKGEVYHRDHQYDWQDQPRVWTRKERGSPHWIEVSGQVDRVVVSEDAIHLEAGQQRVKVAQDQESDPKRGMSRGLVESVTE